MPDPISRAVSQAVFRWDATLSPPAVRAISDVAQFGIVLAILVVGLGALWASRGSPRDRIVDATMRVLPGIIAVVIALLAVQILSRVVPEARPFVVLGQQPLFAHAPDASFPSDHVSGGMAMLAARVGPRTKTLTFVIVAAIAVARVLAGVHWLVDVVGAAVLGLAVAWLTVEAWSTLVMPRVSARAA